MEPDIQMKEGQEPPSGAGPFVGAVIIILLLALGAFYFWNSKLGEANNNPPPLILGNDSAGADATSDSAAGLPPQGNSDSPEAIDADIQAMNIDQFDAQTASSLEAFQQNVQ
ncbi:MAG: hypothetical protein Q7S05_00175 [bacterium]|nr:hypothetical protein [bacterium]